VLAAVAVMLAATNLTSKIHELSDCAERRRMAALPATAICAGGKLAMKEIR